MSLTTTIEIRDSALLTHVARSPLLKRAVDIVGALCCVHAVDEDFPGDSDRDQDEGSQSGPVFFRQTRIGKNGVPFTMVKFRSTRCASEPTLLRAKMQGVTTSRHAIRYKNENDPQVTGNGSLHSALLDRRASAVLDMCSLATCRSSVRARRSRRKWRSQPEASTFVCW